MVVLQHGFVEYVERYVGEHDQLIAYLLGRGYWRCDLARALSGRTRHPDLDRRPHSQTPQMTKRLTSL
jgi:alpha-beta hydrolase superfamily lysophospholipase